jgi:outer membrane murein-binding lipoprotein Lpp
MGTKAKVVSYCHQALGAQDTNQKLDSIARAIAELADFVDDLENQLRRVENNQR